MIRRICLFGGPGCGKSVTSSGLFHDLKKEKLNVELVFEYIKQWVYLSRSPRSFDQVYVFSKQLHAEDVILRTNVDLIITDSPILLACSYARDTDVCWKQLLEIWRDFEKVYPSLNIFLSREGIDYQSRGRYHNYDEAVDLDTKIKDLMDYYLPSYETFPAIDYNSIKSYVLENISK